MRWTVRWGELLPRLKDTNYHRMWTVRRELSEDVTSQKLWIVRVWHIRECELSEDVNYQRMWPVRGCELLLYGINCHTCELSDYVNCPKRSVRGCHISDVNCQRIWTVRGCKLSEENCQRMCHGRNYELTENVTYQRIWTVRGYKLSECDLSENVNCQRIWTMYVMSQMM